MSSHLFPNNTLQHELQFFSFVTPPVLAPLDPSPAFVPMDPPPAFVPKDPPLISEKIHTFVHTYSDWKCDNCSKNSTSEKFEGPNGPQTLCERCEITWRKLDKPPIPFDLMNKGRSKKASKDDIPWNCKSCSMNEIKGRRRRGPEGSATLCNRCGIAWSKLKNSSQPAAAQDSLVSKKVRPLKRDNVLESTTWFCKNCLKEYSGKIKAGPEGKKTLCIDCHRIWHYLGNPAQMPK